MKQIAIEWNNGSCYLNSLDFKKILTHIWTWTWNTLEFQYNLSSPYLVHTLIIKIACQPGICHLTLTAFSWTTGYVKFTSGFHQCLNGFSFSKTIQPIWSMHVSQKYITWLWPHSHGMLTSFNSLKVFVILSVSSLPFTQGSPYLVHTLIMEDICRPEIYRLTLTSFSWYADFIKFTSSFRD